MNKKQKKDYFDEFPLDDYEMELEEFLEKGEFVSIKNFEKRKKELEESAKNFLELQKTKRKESIFLRSFINLSAFGLSTSYKESFEAFSLR